MECGGCGSYRFGIDGAIVRVVTVVTRVRSASMMVGLGAARIVGVVGIVMAARRRSRRRDTVLLHRRRDGIVAAILRGVAIAIIIRNELHGTHGTEFE